MSNTLFENLRSTIEHFQYWESTTPDNIFLRQPKGDIWKTWTYAEAGEEARKVAAGLLANGINKGDHIAISSKNCAHWIIADLAIMIAECISVPLYPSLGGDQLKTVLEKSDSVALFAGKLEEWQSKKSGISSDIKVFKFPHYDGNAEVDMGIEWAELSKHEPITEKISPDLDGLWTILFTSGTTGTPKGVMHTHRNAALIMNNELQNGNIGITKGTASRFFSFLPLNHIAERTAVEMGAFMFGGSISFAESLDTFAKNLQDTKPTFLFAVPRIWTKFQLGVLSKMPQKKMDKLLKIPIVSSMVKKKIRAGLGLSECEVFLTGASITPESLKQWYRRLGINLREVYGMTENGGGFTLMPKDRHKPDTVGKPLTNSEGRIDPNTGEVLMKMPWLMTGYYKEPELTANTVIDGWMHTGDKGKMDDEGFISIIGRVKDAFKTSKGKFIVPTTIEDLFAENDYIEQICVAGLTCPQPVALVCLSEIGQKMDQQEVRSSLEKELDKANKQLENHERVSTIIVAKDAWSDQNNLLTPTLKIRRGAINDRYGHKLAEWHEVESKVVWES